MGHNAEQLGGDDLQHGRSGRRLPPQHVRHDLRPLVVWSSHLHQPGARVEDPVRAHSVLIKWSPVFWVGAVGAIAVLAGGLR